MLTEKEFSGVAKNVKGDFEVSDYGAQIFGSVMTKKGNIHRIFHCNVANGGCNTLTELKDFIAYTCKDMIGILDQKYDENLKEIDKS